MTRQEFHTVDVLRLEVEQTPGPGVLVNLIQNPHGDLGAWGWLTPVAGSSMVTSLYNGARWFEFIPAGYGTGAHPGYFTTEPYPVSAGQYVAARWDQASIDATQYSRVSVEWLDAAGAVISSSAQTGYLAATVAARETGGTAYSTPARQAPAGTVRARLRFDLTSGTNPWNNPSTIFAFRRPVWVKGATAAAVTNPPLSAIEPAIYTDITGPSTTITIERAELDVGILNATIPDATLDPSQVDLIRPGKRVRLLAGTSRGPLFTGKISAGSTKYDLKVPGPQHARISLTAVDAVSQLAQVPAPNGVGTIPELPYVLEGAGVPWLINSQSGHRSTATIVATNTAAKALDQVAITRDSKLGLAWVDRRGVLVARDRATVPTSPVATLDETDYTDLDVDWDWERCINVVNIKLLRVNIATGETVEISYGPYIDQASVDEWGPRSKDFTIQGIPDTEAAAAAYAAQILAANATPVVRINALTFPITEVSQLSQTVARRAFIDLYDPIRTVNLDGGIDQVVRPTSIKHVITPKKWLVTLNFAASDSVAAPMQTAPVVSAPTVPAAQLPSEVWAGGASVTTDANGLGVISHEHGFIPSGVLVQAELGTGMVYLAPTERSSWTNAQIRIRAWVGSTGAAYTGTLSNVRYLMWK